MSVAVGKLFDLTGRVAIVTGGSRGLGAEIAEGLAEAGAKLMVCARRDQWLTPFVADMRARGVRIEGRVCDVSAPDQVQSVIDCAITQFGRIDILVNNAGITWTEAPETMPLAQWQRVLDVNLTGAFLFAQAAGRHMIAHGTGCIINVCSVAGLRAAMSSPDYAGYAASKAGLAGLTRELAASWGGHGIRVNAIAPGFFRTRLVESVVGRAEEQLATCAPIPRIGAPGELKGVAVFLASDAASYVTGQTIVVDGGVTIA